jgi:hypothetical protein
LDVLFTQAGLARTVTANELFLAHPGHGFIGTHALSYREVVNGDVLKSLLTHALGDQRLNFLNCLDELLGGQAELLWAHGQLL